MTEDRDRVLKRWKSEPDLKVVADDGEVMVHSLILMLASPIFEAMLKSPMQEGSAREIRLHGKTTHELAWFYKSLQTSTMVPLTKDIAMFLTRWADEYQMETLKNMCEDYLVSTVPVDASSLKHAVMYNLQKRSLQCITTMKQDVPKYADDLRVLAEAGASEHLQEVWPALCLHAGVQAFPMPSSHEVTCMWPFLVAAVEAYKRAHDHEKAARDFDRLRADAETWPHEAFTTLPSTGKASNMRACHFIYQKLAGHGIDPLPPLPEQI